MATNESIAFGQRLRELRAECHVSQDTLAHRTGIHPTAIGRFERGDREPRLRSILRLADGLGVTAGLLLDGLHCTDHAAKMQDSVRRLGKNV